MLTFPSAEDTEPPPPPPPRSTRPFNPGPAEPPAPSTVAPVRSNSNGPCGPFFAAVPEPSDGAEPSGKILAGVIVGCVRPGDLELPMPALPAPLPRPSPPLPPASPPPPPPASITRSLGPPRPPAPVYHSSSPLAVLGGGPKPPSGRLHDRHLEPMRTSLSLGTIAKIAAARAFFVEGKNGQGWRRNRVVGRSSWLLPKMERKISKVPFRPKEGRMNPSGCMTNT